MPRSLLFVAAAALALNSALLFGASPPQTERRYLSGHGPEDAVPWEFTVSGGRRAGERTTIPVPSNWELHGFGTYNYGQEKNKGDEHGRYRLRFAVPTDWKGRRVRLVFEGVMTDATVTLNGRPAGPTHQGGFYRFRYNVTDLLKFGDGSGNENVLEVDVGKVSANADTERAERAADYWVFGGIFRPVWLEASPAQAIDHVAIDARADGTITAEINLDSVLEADRLEAQVLDAEGRPVGAAFGAAVPAGGSGRIRLQGHVDAAKTWTAETPQLYSLRVSLSATKSGAAELLHQVTERFGFRTFEVRRGEGLFLNGQRIMLKGVNRHSFRPETGRALSRENCYEDVRLIRQLNMNAVRMSHYPPDPAFLEACDELGLYVLDELSSWQHGHDTPVGRLLVREMVERDVNHPSILFWDNGNERGWNRELDGDFAFYDPQQRIVLHPQELFNGVETAHYPDYDVMVKLLAGPSPVMPTEFLHGLYDGGAGAGLADYWKALTASKVGAGGFIWVLADEGVVRSDQNGRIDVFSTYAPDGIVGPHHEREASYYTVREIWSPVQIAAPNLDDSFTGRLAVHNGYDFTSLSACRFTWRILAFDTQEKVIAEGTAPSPAVPPHGDGQLSLPLPANWREADALGVTATGPGGADLWTWRWSTARLAARVRAMAAARAPGTARVERAPTAIALRAGDVVAVFDPASGEVLRFARAAQESPLQHGPRLVFARPATGAAVEWLNARPGDATDLTRQLATPAVANVVEIEFQGHRDAAYVSFKLDLSADGQTWKTIFDSSRRSNDGTRYEFAPQFISAVRLTNVRRPDGQPAVLKTLRIGHAAARFPAGQSATATVTSGVTPEAKTGSTSAWLEARGGGGLDRVRWTLRGDGSLQLDYAYTLRGDFTYHGITFDLPQDKIVSRRWLGEGPFRVWQNRIQGTWLGLHETKQHLLQPGESWDYPEFEGYFAGTRWTRFATANGGLTVILPEGQPFLRIGTSPISQGTVTVDFPPGDLSFVHAIPAIGWKNRPVEKAGPASQPAKAAGTYSGTVVFRIEE